MAEIVWQSFPAKHVATFMTGYSFDARAVSVAGAYKVAAHVLNKTIGTQNEFWGGDDIIEARKAMLKGVTPSIASRLQIVAEQMSVFVGTDRISDANFALINRSIDALFPSGEIEIAALRL